MVLENMVDADSVDDELEAEVADECSKFGRVTRVAVSSEQQDDSQHADSYEQPADVVRVFVEFTSQSGTSNCWLLSSISRCLTLFVSDLFSGPRRAVSPVCVFQYLDNNLWTNWPLT